MGVAIQATSGGRRRLEFEINVVPFLDLLSVCITFLLVTAVWTTMDTLAVDQSVGSEVTPAPEPPAVLRIGRDALSFGRGAERTVRADWSAAEAAMALDRQQFPDDPAFVLVTEDGVEYGSMIRGLDQAKSLGYSVSLGSP
jgi:biopolymer transport protein TolR